MKNFIFIIIILICVAYFSSLRKSNNNITDRDLVTGCITPIGGDKRKVRLENKILGEVKFMGEQEVFSSIQSTMAENKIPAVSLAMIKDGKIEWTELYKNPQFPEQKKLDCTSIFQTASLSKPVTFLAALRMHSAGTIQLDKNIQSYLNDFVLPQGKQTADNPVTFRNLFSHTSGITQGGYQGYPTGLALPSDINILKGNAGTNSPAIAIITPPNEILAYSGGGYTLSELALQDIYNDDFSSIMKNWILDPVGMVYSDFSQPLSASKYKKAAKGYTQSGEVLIGGWHNYPEQAAAGLWSNAEDMAKFLIEIYKAYHGNSDIISQSEIKTIISQERDGHIYGFIVDRSESGLAITHYAGNAGYGASMTIDLVTGNGIVFLINSDNSYKLARKILFSASKIYDWQHFKQTNVYRESLNTKILRGLTGNYKWNGQTDISIRYDENNNQVSLYYPSGDKYELSPIDGDELDFIHPNSGTKVSFIKANAFQSFRLYGQLAVKIMN